MVWMPSKNLPLSHFPSCSPFYDTTKSPQHIVRPDSGLGHLHVKIKSTLPRIRTRDPNHDLDIRRTL